jgi:hypothetical protein
VIEEQLDTTCAGCGRELSETDRMLVYRTEAGERQAYECPSGAVTITVTAVAAPNPRRTAPGRGESVKTMFLNAEAGWFLPVLG